jgi:hypothetical protein
MPSQNAESQSEELASVADMSHDAVEDATSDTSVETKLATEANGSENQEDPEVDNARVEVSTGGGDTTGAGVLLGEIIFSMACLTARYSAKVERFCSQSAGVGSHPVAFWIDFDHARISDFRTARRCIS